MTTTTAGGTDRGRRSPLPIVALLILSAVGWSLTVCWAKKMGNGPGPMGLGVASFVGVWIVMMVAMMMPSLSTLRTPSASPLVVCSATAEFVAGYLGIWAVAGGVAYVLSLGTESLAQHHRTGATVLAVGLFVACAVYQVSPWKWRALRACAEPVTPVVDAAAAVGAGLRHGGRCLATSWSAMALLVAVGFMQLDAMIAIAAAILIERRSQRRAVSALLGLVALGFGIAVALRPSLASGLFANPMGGM